MMDSNDSLYPVPFNEERRQRAVAASGLQGLEGDARLESILRLLQAVLGTDCLAIALIPGSDLQVLASLGPLPAGRARAGSPCAYAIMQDEPLVVPDMDADLRFPAAPGRPRFYAGQALIDGQGFRIGTVFAQDPHPRADGLTASAVQALQEAASLIMAVAPALVLASGAGLGAAAPPPPGSGSVAEDEEEANLRHMATIAHEIRSPLAGVTTALDIIATEQLGPVGVEAYATYAREAARIARTITDIVSKTLDLTRLLRGDVQLDDKVISLGALVSEVLRTQEPLAREAGIKPIASDFSRIRVTADRTYLFQMLSNLVQNALKYTPARGQVLVGLSEADDGTLDIHVRDTGRGMSQEDIQRALKPFSMVGASGHGQQGVGLGLSLVKRLVEVHGGRLLIDSAPERGTTMTLRFPAWRVVQEAADIPAPLGTGDRLL